jgi:hypothetical protein
MANTFDVQAAAAGVPVTVNTGAAGSSVVLSSATKTLDTIKSLVTVNAQGANTSLLVDEEGATSGDTVVLDSSSMVSQKVGFTVNYQAGGGAFTSVKLVTAGGGSVVLVRGTVAGAVTSLYTLGPSNSISVASAAATLDTIKGQLDIDAGTGNNTLLVDDAGRTTDEGIVMAASSITGGSLLINYTASGGTFGVGVYFEAGSGNNTILVTGTAAGANTYVETGSGTDTVYANVSRGNGTLVVVGQAPSNGPGTDTLRVADVMGGAILHNFIFSPKNGVLQAVYPDGSQDLVYYYNVAQLFTNPPAS